MKVLSALLFVAVLQGGALDVQAGAACKEGPPQGIGTSPCAASNPKFSECLDPQLSKTIIPTIAPGDAKLGIRKLEPLAIPEDIVLHGEGGRALLQGCSVTGASKATYSDITTDVKTFLGYGYTVPYLELSCSSYQIDAKFLGVNRKISGKKFSLIWRGYHSKIRHDAKRYQQCNGIYITFLTCTPTFLSPKTFQARFDGLSPAENAKLNAKLYEVFKAAFPPVECRIVKAYIQEVYDKLPSLEKWIPATKPSNATICLAHHPKC